MANHKTYVTSPLLPDLEQFHELLKEIWESKWITNNGSFHKQLEEELRVHLGISNISLFANGTLPLVTALHALGIHGEVITTPYSFAATAHAIRWAGCTPVFADVDPLTANLDPEKIEAAITPETEAIMPVHCYGNPCDVKRIKQIADRHGLKIIYDAAHSFGVEIPVENQSTESSVKTESILNWGDISTLSFHATKVYNTIEGGALITNDDKIKKTVDLMKNFGIESEESIPLDGINAKLDEIRAAYGILNLRLVEDAISRRKRVASQYGEMLKGIEGIRMIEEMPGVKSNYSYFPVFIDEAVFGCSRDHLYLDMAKEGIFCRRYFYPLLSDLAAYNELKSADPDNLPAAHRLANTVLCLPIHHEMGSFEVENIVSLIKKASHHGL